MCLLEARTTPTVDDETRTCIRAVGGFVRARVEMGGEICEQVAWHGLCDPE